MKVIVEFMYSLKNLSYGFSEAVLLMLCEVTYFFLFFFVLGEVCLTLVFHVLFQNNCISLILLCLYTLQKKKEVITFKINIFILTCLVFYPLSRMT